MRTEEFDYNLPEELIAQTPLEKRDESRLLVVDRKNGKIEHNHFKNIFSYLEKGDVLVLNDTKVLPARLLGRKEETNAHIELLMLKEINKDTWECLTKPFKRIKEGTILFTMTGTKGKRDYFFTHLVRKQDIETRKLYLNQRVGCLIPTEMIYAGYYNYLLKDKRILDSIFIYETGTANQGNLGIESIRRTKLHFPPVEEQKAISNYLDQKCYGIDRLIERKIMIIEKLLEYKKSLIYEVVTGKREV